MPSNALGTGENTSVFSMLIKNEMKVFTYIIISEHPGV